MTIYNHIIFACLLAVVVEPLAVAVEPVAGALCDPEVRDCDTSLSYGMAAMRQARAKALAASGRQLTNDPKKFPGRYIDCGTVLDMDNCFDDCVTVPLYDRLVHMVCPNPYLTGLVADMNEQLDAGLFVNRRTKRISVAEFVNPINWNDLGVSYSIKNGD